MKSDMAKSKGVGSRAIKRAQVSNGPSSRETYHHGNLRSALIDAALRILNAGGVDALTLRATARAAGVSQAAPYRHFADKDELLAAVAEEGFRAMGAAVTAALATVEANHVARFRAQGMTYIRFAVEHPAQFRLMFGRELADHSKHGGLKAAASETFARLIGAVQKGQELGIVRSGNFEDQAMAAWSMVHGLSSLLVDGQLTPGEEPLDVFANRALQYLFLGLRSENFKI
jgi:AcrR family transcriptional regulator